MQIQTSRISNELRVIVADAQVNCKPARVLRIGKERRNSGAGLLSILINCLCLASLNAASQVERFSVLEKIILKLSTESLF